MKQLGSWIVAAAGVIASGVTASAQPGQRYEAMHEDARRELIMRWAVKPDQAACERIYAGLTDPSADIRLRAANALYWKCDRSVTGRLAVNALCRSIELGNGHAGAWLLLGYAPAAEALPCLRRPLRRGAMVKLITSSRPLSPSLAASIAMARLGDPAAISALRTAFEKPTLDEALLLLAALPDIEDPTSLNASVRLLDDNKRQAPGPDSHHSRALRNVALEALVAKLNLKPGFAVDPVEARSYSNTEIEEVRKAAKLALQGR